MAIRSSTLAEVKVLSLASLAAWSLEDNQEISKQGKPSSPTDAISRFKGAGAQTPIDPVTLMKDLFRTVGLATNISIDENYGTTPLYSVGAPMRPKMLPGNYQATVSMERLQLDRRDNFSFVTSPEYWNSVSVQRQLGIEADWSLYTYLCLWDREQKISNLMDQEIYALMPQSARKQITSQDTMINHNVSMVGFKYRYEDILGLFWPTNDSVLDFGRTVSGSGQFPFGSIYNAKTGSTSAAPPVPTNDHGR